MLCDKGLRKISAPLPGVALHRKDAMATGKDNESGSVTDHPGCRARFPGAVPCARPKGKQFPVAVNVQAEPTRAFNASARQIHAGQWCRLAARK